MSRALDRGDVSAYATGAERRLAYGLGIKPQPIDFESAAQLYDFALTKRIAEILQAEGTSIGVNIPTLKKRIDVQGTSIEEELVGGAPGSIFDFTPGPAGFPIHIPTKEE